MEEPTAVVVGGAGADAEEPAVVVVGGGGDDVEEPAAVVVGGAGSGVRVVARICPPGPASAAATTSSLFKVAAVHRHHPDPDSSSALVSFVIHDDRRSTTASASASATGRPPLSARKDKAAGCNYKLDWCYPKDEPNHHIFRNEVKPLIHRLSSSSSSNACCVVACGGATANTHLLMGSEDQPGLLTMAMAQVLEFSKAIGGAVSVSSYQVLQDNHFFDLLEPKDHEVLILEDADGTTHLKGLSRVDVKSIEEFAQLCCCAINQHKRPTKTSSQSQSQGHRGLIIYVSRFDQQGRECAVSKMNFLNLAGYVDPKQKNYSGGLSLPNSNKSLYGLMNVVQALNSNQSFVPYRQSKVTRILQDSLCKTSGAVLIACLDEVSCQDAVSIVSLASRSSQVVNKQCYIHQPKSSSTANASRTPIANKRSQPILHSSKIPGCSHSTLKMKKNDDNPTVSGRKLFSPSTTSSKEDAIVVSTVLKQAEEVQPSLGLKIQGVVDDVSAKIQEVIPCSMQELVSSSSKSSPKLSDRLREISNSLKQLSTQPVSMMAQINTDAPEPKIPAVHLKFGEADDPKDVLTGMKKSLVQELLAFLNIANKEQLKSLKGIGEKRANYILELREESSELFKEIDDLRDILGMNSKEIKKMMSGIMDA